MIGFGILIDFLGLGVLQKYFILIKFEEIESEKGSHGWVKIIIIL